MREIEALRTESELAEARVEMARWCADVPRRELLEYLEGAELAPGIHEGIALLRAHNVTCAISSITWRFAVAWFAARLEIAHYQGTDFAADGTLAHVWPRNKGVWVRQLGESLGIAREHIAAVGDSWRDLEMFEASGRAFFVGRDGAALPDFVTHVPEGNILAIARSIIAGATSPHEPIGT